jgi:hypothetical protein
MRSTDQPIGGAIWASWMILLHRQSGNDAAIFRDQRQAIGGSLVRCHPVERLVIKPDLAVGDLGIVEAGDGAQGRGLAGPVAPQQGKDFAFVHIEVHALNDVALTVVGMQVVDREVGRRGGGMVGVLRKIGARLVRGRVFYQRRHALSPK